ncbi:hypothetical protein CXB51_022180 [Gossypium anomalum]|uniref:Myb/SANT-like domain-containing protein n=1 Tax=Gossypium anomalum TaxID=47600 RepID=A0A8J5YJV0_9ROSI|nr:hypothetical protein CXB51_022180 [Gossypium anomalum]
MVGKIMLLRDILRDAISRRHGLKVPHGFSQSSASSQNSGGTKRKWVPKEDVALVACMVDLYNAKPNLESGIRTLKRDSATVYDVLSEKTIVALSHKNSRGQFRNHSFPYYDQLTFIYAKDRATRKDAQTATDIVKEIYAEDVATANNLEEGNNYQDAKMMFHCMRWMS